MLARRIDRLDPLAGDGSLRQVDDRQRHGAVAAATGIGEHDREGRRLAVDHRHLLAVEAAVAEGRADGARLGRLRTLGNGERADHLARRQLGQPLLLLCVGTRKLQRFGRQHDRTVERHGRGRAADLFGDDADFERRQTEPAIGFGNARGRHAEIDETLPDVIGVGFVAVEHAPHHFGGALVGEEFANLLLEQLLVVGEIEVHDEPTLASLVPSGNGLGFRQAGWEAC